MGTILSKIEYTKICYITSELADLLDTITPDGTPSRTYIEPNDDYKIGKLQAYAATHPDEADDIQKLLDEINETDGLDIAWG